MDYVGNYFMKYRVLLIIAMVASLYSPVTLHASEHTADNFSSAPQLDSSFTPDEIKWLNKKQPLTYVYDPDWAPFEWKNNLGHHTGIIADILSLIKKKTDLDITPVHTKTWDESVDLVKSGKVDMFSAITKNASREEYLHFTSKDIYTYPAVLITKFDDKAVYLDLNKDFKNKKVGIVKSSGLGRYIKDNYPNIEYMELPNTQAGFTSIRQNKIDVFAINTVTAKYYIEKQGFDDLKIALKLDYIYHLKIAIRKDMPREIISILDKSLSNISEEEFYEIFIRWTQVPIKEVTDWSLVYKIITAFLIIITILIGFNRRLNRKVAARTKELTTKNMELKNLLVEVKDRTAESLDAKDETEKATQSLLVQQEKLTSLGRIAANVAHEMNTPLGIAKTGLSFHQNLVYKVKTSFAEKSLTASAMEDYINQSEEVMSTISNNLERAITLASNFKHTAVDRTDERQHEHNLYKLVSRITTSMNTEFIRNHITCNLNIDKSINLTTHGSDLSQVICNLTMNSVVHAFEGRENRTIDISAYQADKSIALSITDNGLGVDESIRERIFEPFVTTKRDQGGTGLGLNIVQDLVKERLQGTIELLSPEDMGTQWCIRLPLQLSDSNESN